MINFFVLSLVLVSSCGHRVERCHFCQAGPENPCSSGSAPGISISCSSEEPVEKGNVYCYVFKTDNDTRYTKNCLDYGAEPDDFLAAWPEDQNCVTITDGEIKGIPNGHGCKCAEDNCNFDMCTAAGNTDPEDEECKTINCQKCVFPFLYKGIEYDTCITVDSDNNAPWCAVQIEEDGEATYGAWEDCAPGCPTPPTWSSSTTKTTTRRTTTRRTTTEGGVTQTAKPGGHSGCVCNHGIFLLICLNILVVRIFDISL